MKMSVFCKLMEEYGDAYVTYISPVSKKEKFNVATMDLDNKYIKSKPKPPKIDKKDTDKVLLFCWDTDSWKVLDVKAILRVTSLSSELERKR